MNETLTVPELAQRLRLSRRQTHNLVTIFRTNKPWPTHGYPSGPAGALLITEEDVRTISWLYQYASSIPFADLVRACFYPASTLRMFFQDFSKMGLDAPFAETGPAHTSVEEEAMQKKLDVMSRQLDLVLIRLSALDPASAPLTPATARPAPAPAPAPTPASITKPVE